MSLGLNGIFPVPISIAARESDDLDSKLVEAEIKDEVETGMHKNYGNSTSDNTYIFDTKFKKIKQFSEQQLKIYVEQIICPKKELDLYITQSWLNITKPGEFHHEHSHPNSIISGVFYISTEEDDNIMFTDPNIKIKDIIKFEPKQVNPFNSHICFFPTIINELILFPSWLNHQVIPNEKATTDRISISFNTFVKGTLGDRKGLNELIL